MATGSNRVNLGRKEGGRKEEIGARYDIPYSRTIPETTTLVRKGEEEEKEEDKLTGLNYN